MISLNLRIYRTYTWEIDINECQTDEKSSYHLVSHDTLQYSTSVDPWYPVWNDVPIVESGIPKHPKF